MTQTLAKQRADIAPEFVPHNIGIALRGLRESRDLLRRCGSSRAADKVAAAIKSTEGALRHASGRALTIAIEASGGDHYEKIARAFGWTHGGDGDGFIYDSTEYDSWKAALSWSGTGGDNDRGPIYSTWRECCEAEDFDPYHHAADEAGWRKATDAEMAQGFCGFQHDESGTQSDAADWRTLCMREGVPPYGCFCVTVNYQTASGDASSYKETLIEASEDDAHRMASMNLRSDKRHSVGRIDGGDVVVLVVPPTV